MHYYKFNIGDYRKDTGHLSPMEHYIYRSLIDWYYLDENPIPKRTQRVMRRLSLGSEHDELLNNVLTDFFIETVDGWQHTRIEIDIQAYRENVKTNKENGKKGGRPKNQQVKKDIKPKITQSVNDGNRNEPSPNPNYKPITNNQLKEKTCALFDRFWMAGMKKQDKKKARVAFDRVIKAKPDKEAFVDNLVLDIQKRLSLDQLGFDKLHPTTYLNGERWEDDYAENHNTGGGNNETRKQTGAEISQHLRDRIAARSGGNGIAQNEFDGSVVASYE